MENNILKHRMEVMDNIAKSFGYEKSEDLLEKAEDNDIEKAKHQDGDMHPNGKWIWRASANGGKGDWRVAKPGGRKATDGGGASATTKTNAAAKTSSSTLSDKEKNTFVDIMKKNSSHKDAHMNLEQMSDDELRKFANAASLLAGDKTNLNDKTRANIKGWMKLAQDEQTARRNNKKTEGATKKTISKQKDNKSSNTVTHDINGTKVTVTKNSDGSYTLEANGKNVKSDDPSFFVNGTNLKPRVKAALAKEVGLETKKPILSQNDKTSIRSVVKKMFPRSDVSFSTKDELIVEVEGKAYGDSYSVWKEWKLKDGEPTEGGYSGDTSKSRIDELMKKLGKENLKKLKRISLKESYD